MFIYYLARANRYGKEEEKPKTKNNTGTHNTRVV
jgi:hypothetical protein